MVRNLKLILEDTDGILTRIMEIETAIRKVRQPIRLQVQALLFKVSDQMQLIRLLVENESAHGIETETVRAESHAALGNS